MYIHVYKRFAIVERRWWGQVSHAKMDSWFLFITSIIVAATFMTLITFVVYLVILICKPEDGHHEKFNYSEILEQEEYCIKEEIYELRENTKKVTFNPYVEHHGWV